MRATLDDAALVHHGDLPGTLDGGQAVRDHQGGAVAHQALQRLLDQLLRFGVERAGRLVQHQDRRVLEDRARDRDALALAAGKRVAGLPDLRVDALRQARDELHRIRRLGRGHDVRFAGAGKFAVGDVVGHGVVEQHHALPDPGDLPAQRSQRVVFVILAVQHDAPGAGRIEARQQADQAALAAAGTADQRGHRAGRAVQVHAAQGLELAARISQADIFKTDVAARPHDVPATRIGLRWHVDDLEQVRGGGQAALDVRLHRGQPFQ